jgi:hydroxypyruvate isomerase
MLKFSANLGMLFPEVDFYGRFSCAAAAGFTAVEYPFPYAYPGHRLSEALEQHGLSQVLFNLPPGDWDAGERGIACLPDRRGEFQDGVGRALEYARALGCGKLNCLAGAATGVDRDTAEATLRDNLCFAARALDDCGVQLLIEPINTRDMPGFLLNTSRHAIELIEALSPLPLWLQYDVYHMQIMEGDLAPTLERYLSHIGHIQIADTPGRHEPGSGEIHYPFLFRHLERLGYEGYVGCEYHPATSTAAGLEWLRQYRASTPRGSG